MGRRFGMWTAIICVLVVGVSVTKMTNDFVSSNGVEAAAIANVMDASVPLTSGMGAVESAIESFTVKNTVTSEKERKDERMPRSAALKRAETEDVSNESAVSEEGTNLVTDASEFENEAASDFASEEAAVPEAAAYSFHTASIEAEEESHHAMESVKSPLDPAIENEGPYAEDGFLKTETDSDYFKERFSAAEISTSALWDPVTSENPAAFYNAAEQEHVLWEHELNLVYATVLEKLTEQEAEELKALELEWMKERDRYANKSLAVGKNKSLQSSDYLQALTLMTKERCYWFLDVYGEVLDSKE